MRGALRILTPRTRQGVVAEVSGLPDGFEVVLREPTRSNDQNAKMWAMLSDVAKAAPEGRKWSSEVWKCAFMQHLGHEVRWVQGLDGDPLPVGFRTSRLRKQQMADLINCIYEYGDRHGVEWSEPYPYEEVTK